MKLFRLFKSKETRDSKSKRNDGRSSDETARSSDKTSDVRRSAKSKNSSKSMRSRAKSDRAPVENVEVPTTRETNAFRTTEKMMAVMNSYDPENPQAYIDILCDFFQDGKEGKVLGEDGETNTAEQCATLLTFLHNACPSDYKMRHSNIVQQGKNHFTVVGVSPHGTFSGSPLTIMPGVLPAVAPSGEFVTLDEENYRCLMNEDGTKIVQVEVISMGNLTGFAGFYEACGGSLTPPVQLQ